MAHFSSRGSICCHIHSQISKTFHFLQILSIQTHTPGRARATKQGHPINAIYTYTLAWAWYPFYQPTFTGGWTAGLTVDWLLQPGFEPMHLSTEVLTTLFTFSLKFPISHTLQNSHTSVCSFSLECATNTHQQTLQVLLTSCKLHTCNSLSLRSLNSFINRLNKSWWHPTPLLQTHLHWKSLILPSTYLQTCLMLLLKIP